MINGPNGGEACDGCGKPVALCVCDAISPVANRTEVLILRHPQEQDKALGTAGIAVSQLERAHLRTGLSWPNLTRALGRDAESKAWGVLYLGAAREGAGSYDRVVTAVDRKGLPLQDQDRVLSALKGVIALDGNWQQVKALWWRNPWLLKCRRLVLSPDRPSLYGTLRREPRKESVSTIEAIALTLAVIENNARMVDAILPPFRRLLEKSHSPKSKPIGEKPIDAEDRVR